MWLEDMHFVQICNGYELTIDTFGKTYDDEFQNHECELYYGWTLHVMNAITMCILLWCYRVLYVCVCVCDMLHHLIMSNCWIYKWYYTMHQWNMTIQKERKKYHAIFNSLWINIKSWIGKFYGSLPSWPYLGLTTLPFGIHILFN
jgi:hypothetical protein